MKTHKSREQKPNDAGLAAFRHATAASLTWDGDPSSQALRLGEMLGARASSQLCSSRNLATFGPSSLISNKHWSDSQIECPLGGGRQTNSAHRRVHRYAHKVVRCSRRAIHDQNTSSRPVSDVDRAEMKGELPAVPLQPCARIPKIASSFGWPCVGAVTQPEISRA